MTNEERKDRIVETALGMFNARGCRGVTMDDIAQEQHMSKRTLYETFATKEELLEACLQMVHRRTDDMHRRAHSRVDEPLLVAMYMLHTNALFIHRYSRLMEELKRYYPEVHDRFLAEHEKGLRAVMARGFEYIRERGYLRPDADTELATDFFCDLMQQHRPAAGTDASGYAQHINELCYTYLRGMMTSATLARYDSQEEHFRNVMKELEAEF